MSRARATINQCLLSRESGEKKEKEKEKTKRRTKGGHLRE